MKNAVTLSVRYKLEGVPYEKEIRIKARRKLPPLNWECIDGNIWCCIFEMQKHEFSRDELYYHKDAEAAARFYLKFKMAQLAFEGYRIKVKNIQFVETEY